MKRILLATLSLCLCTFLKAQPTAKAPDPLVPAKELLTTQQAFDDVLERLKTSHSLTDEEYSIARSYVKRDGYDILWAAFAKDVDGIRHWRFLNRNSDSDWRQIWEQIRGTTRKTGGTDSEDLVCELAIRYIATMEK